MKAVTERWTYKHYSKLKDDRRYEILGGELKEMPAPSLTHQRVVFELAKSLDSFVREKGIGYIFISPVDVVLSEENVLQPDIVFVSRDREDILKEKGIFGSPDMVVEVVSPATFKRDTEDKKKLYARFGVKELWLVFPNDKVVEVFALKGNSYEVYSFASEEGEITSPLLEGFRLNIADLFKEVKA